MKKFSFFIILLLLNSSLLLAQMGINTDGSAPNNSAMLDVKSTDKGFLPPRMTHAEMNSISNPAEGLIVFCTDCGLNGTGVVVVFMNGAWNTIAINCILPDSPISGIQVPSPTHIVWNWNTVTGATGYKWNTTNDYATATDMAMTTTKTETGLTCNTAYTRYAWAYSACGNSTALTMNQTSSGCSLTCEQLLTDIRDGKTYTTVLIGDQCWMAQNLNIGARVNGSDEQTNNSIIEKYCWGDLESNCDVYGGLYQWNEMMQYVITEGAKGICPTGWHLPTDAEWTTLTTFLGGEQVAGGKMKEAGYVHWISPNTGATNSSGFTALPGGYRSFFFTFDQLTYFVYFWSSSQGAVGGGWYRSLYDFDENVVQYYDYNNTDGMSVRCLKD
jgi:uncharacterized protein (TIGR02145 family)